MKTNQLSLHSLLALLVWCAASASASPAASAEARGGQPPVRPPKAHSYGRTLEEWAALWCQRKALFVEQEKAEEVCDYGMAGPVLFLANGSEATQADEFHTNLRDCMAPEGAALFFPIHYTFVYSTPDFPLTEADLRAQTSLYLSYTTNRHCEVDGRPIEDLERYRRQTPAFSVTFSDANGYPGATYEPAMADGYWLLLAPLSVGSHTIHVVSGDSGSDYYVDLLIRLTIVPAGQPRIDANTHFSVPSVPSCSNPLLKFNQRCTVPGHSCLLVSLRG